MNPFDQFKVDFKKDLEASNQKVVEQVRYERDICVEVHIISITHLNTPRTRKLNRKLNL